MQSAVLRLGLSTILALQLAAGGGVALPGGVPVIGQVILSSNAQVGDLSLPGKGTLLDNDLVRTERDGRVVVDFPLKSRAAVGEQTRVRFRSVSGRRVANLDEGTVTALSQRQSVVGIETARYRIEPGQGDKTVFLVALLPTYSTTVKAGLGNVFITDKSSGERYELREGLFATIPAAAGGLPAAPGQEKEASKPAPEPPAQPAPAPAPTAPPPKPPWHIGTMSPGASAAVVAGIAGAGIAGAAAAAGGGGGGGGGGTVSPTR